MHLVFNAQKKNYSVNMKAATLASLFGVYICIFFMAARAAPRSNPEFARSFEDERQVSIYIVTNSALAVFETFHFLYRLHNSLKGLALHVLGTRIVKWNMYHWNYQHDEASCLWPKQDAIVQLIQYERNRRQSVSYTTEEIVAQALCQSSTASSGRVYAVGRDCRWPTHTDTCERICSSKFLHVQDAQTAHDTWSCIAAFHVYPGRPATLSNGNFNTARLGLKSKKEPCTEPSCGPNFCCCIANYE